MAIRQGQDTIDPAAALSEPGGGDSGIRRLAAARQTYTEFPGAGHYRAVKVIKTPGKQQG